MGLRQCEKCGETVDEAKAFCPGCGTALVEEEKAQTTDFQKLDHTVQFGQTMYNQMLEDMGLNIAETSAPADGRIDVLKPIETGATVAPTTTGDSTTGKSTGKIVKESKTPGNLTRYLLAGLAIIILLPIAVVSAIIFFRYLAALIPLK